MSFFDSTFNPHYWAVVPFHFWTAVFFWLGCLVGSFLNVCIYRMPLNLSVVSPPSHCPHCKYSIPFYLNIPLVTWLGLRGRCKHCRAPISPRYFIVELLTGLTFAGCWLAFGTRSPWLALAYCVLLSGLITATFIDFEHFIIPDEITLGGVVVGFVISLLLPLLHQAPSEHPVPGVGEAALRSGLGIVAGWMIVYGVLRAGKWLFGTYAIVLDPPSRVIFTESAIVLPPQRVSLEKLFRSMGWFAFRASRVELLDRCYTNIAVAISAAEVRLYAPSGTETMDRAALVHLEAIVDRVLSSREAARLVGVPLNPFRLGFNWLRQLGETLLRRPKTEIPRSSWLTITPAEAWLFPEDLLFETGEIFYRKTDAVCMQAREVRTESGVWHDVPVRLTPDRLTIGGDQFNPEAVAQMEVVTDRMVLPREAMGFGDVKFMAAIGAFIGWQGVLFSLMASSLIGSVVGISLILAQRRDWSSRMPYGPFIAVAAAIWVFGGQRFFTALFAFNQP